MMENNVWYEVLLEQIAYAEKRRDEELANGTTQDVIYWNGYLNGLRTLQIKTEGKKNEAHRRGQVD